MDESVKIIDRVLRETFEPTHLEIIDDSHQHRGHKAAGGGGHYTVVVVSDKFENVNLIDQRRLVYQALDEQINGTPKVIHALQIKSFTPAEWESRQKTTS